MNHDVPRQYWNVHKHPDDKSLLWNGAGNLADFKVTVERVIRQYLQQPDYCKIDGKAVFSIFSINEFLHGLGGLEQASQAMCQKYEEH